MQRTDFLSRWTGTVGRNLEWKMMRQLDLVAFAVKFSNYCRTTSRPQEPMNMCSLRSHACGRGSRRKSMGAVNQRSNSADNRRQKKSKLFAKADRQRKGKKVVHALRPNRTDKTIEMSRGMASVGGERSFHSTIHTIEFSSVWLCIELIQAPMKARMRSIWILPILFVWDTRRRSFFTICTWRSHNWPYSYVHTVQSCKCINLNANVFTVDFCIFLFHLNWIRCTIGNISNSFAPSFPVRPPFVDRPSGERRERERGSGGKERRAKESTSFELEPVNCIHSRFECGYFRSDSLNRKYWIYRLIFAALEILFSLPVPVSARPAANLVGLLDYCMLFACQLSSISIFVRKWDVIAGTGEQPNGDLLDKITEDSRESWLSAIGSLIQT